MKRRCTRCHYRWSQTNGRCRSCESAIIEEQRKIAAASTEKPFEPSIARRNGFGGAPQAPGLLALSFFGTVFNRR